MVGLASCTQGGFYFFHLLDRYAAGYSILVAVFFEAIAVSWIYGTNRFSEDIRDMIGFSTGKILAGVLAICGTNFPALHHGLRADWLRATDLCGLCVSQLGQCAGLVHSWFLGCDDSCRGDI